MNEFSRKIDENIARVVDFPKEGIQFKDITSLFQNPELIKQMVDAFADFSRGKVDAVCGIESRGFLFGLLIAQKLKVPLYWSENKVSFHQKRFQNLMIWNMEVQPSKFKVNTSKKVKGI